MLFRTEPVHTHKPIHRRRRGRLRPQPPRRRWRR
uniref:Uncharacterized protein n=1 Tax=Arundo donax TaxID=35708 RepID=A0A0A8ZTE6_ARUDO